MTNDQGLKKYEHWSLTQDEDNILWLLFDRKDSSTNSLNEATIRELDDILNNLANTSAKAVIIRSAKKTGFIVGADISQFKTLKTAEEATALIRQGQAVFDKLAALPITTIAVIEGFCLGGGLELALACRYRLAEDSTKTKLGLPEVKLGIHPGWGGTVRLPALVGPLKAMDIILTGRNLSAKTAKKLGVVDEALPKRVIEKAAREYANRKERRKSSFSTNQLLETLPARLALGKVFKRQLDQKISEKHYPSPYRVVDNWVKYDTKHKVAMEQEAISIGKLLVSDTARNLVRVFFLQDQLKNLAKASDFKPKHVHVIGAGVMGGDIAAWCALRGMTVTLQDQAPKLIGNAIKRANELATKQLKEKYLIEAMMDRLQPDPKGYGIPHADVIIEAITEKLTAKQGLFSELEKQAKPDAILATNTSTIPLEEIGSVLKDPNRLVGIHFFNPVAKMPLVEVVHAPNTHKQFIDKAMAFVKKIDKLPLPVKSSPGFLVNRILMPYMLEAVTLLEEGISGPAIDKAAVDYGMPMGPIELADTVGLDICLAAIQELSGVLGAKVPAKLQEYVARGELGRKTGKGFYTYKNGKVVKPKTTATVSEDISNRLILRLLNESVACLREGIVENADLLDAGCIFGIGFPPFRGGPIHYIHSQAQGNENVIDLLQTFKTRYGDRFTPDQGWASGKLQEGASSGQ
ncbi:3-hydroxyacyl-CoA dehydrogenase NAD-binding domain-containing protein [Candidatus Berkiella aquae]|uniref:enoyl-CoA hydratase n=1 Tax=Candidatus Berkiella aquae TaxID=295108 RepID=A0A0Q9YPT8_9GAMM|nr:3-hydroxyacyl-CoA dehydrogenase NAD-binding domain-containing protein [Candidatus Berkiella aquae]MCS5711827.1 enoyl-CoA hydratase/isomerase family protein [Candidatus Berkiella aquae]